jgi:hypothetical protein
MNWMEVDVVNSIDKGLILACWRLISSMALEREIVAGS